MKYLSRTTSVVLLALLFFQNPSAAEEEIPQWIHDLSNVYMENLPKLYEGSDPKKRLEVLKKLLPAASEPVIEKSIAPSVSLSILSIELGEDMTAEALRLCKPERKDAFYQTYSKFYFKLTDEQKAAGVQEKMAEWLLKFHGEGKTDPLLQGASNHFDGKPEDKEKVIAELLSKEGTKIHDWGEVLFDDSWNRQEKWAKNGFEKGQAWHRKGWRN